MATTEKTKRLNRGPRPAHTYRGWKRNDFHRRKPTGNTKPSERAPR